ncbi:hypothetical protein, partial [Caldithrix abyssi]
NACDEILQESRMREIRTSGLRRVKADVKAFALYIPFSTLPNSLRFVFGCGYAVLESFPEKHNTRLGRRTYFKF